MLNYDKIKEFGTVTILGHVNADFDSILSSILLSYLFTQKGIENVIKLADDRVDGNFKKYNINTDFEVGISPSDSLFLVDNTVAYPNNKIIGYIDHHPTTLVDKGENKINLEKTSCAKIIYEIMEQDLSEIPEIYTFYAVLSLFMDSISFHNTKALKEDKEWAINVIKEHGYDYDDLYQSGLCLTDLTRDISSIVMDGFKGYTLDKNVDGFNMVSTYIQTKNKPDQDFIDKCINEIQKQSKYDCWLWLISDIEQNKLYEYDIYKDYYIEHDWDKIYSRGKDLIPRFEKIYKNYSTYKNVIELMIQNNITISTMESCTSGAFASMITNIEGASMIFPGGEVTYSNKAKIMAGVPIDIINKYSVYSNETTEQMALSIKKKFDTQVGIGISGNAGNKDPRNVTGAPGEVFFSIVWNNALYSYKMRIKAYNMLREEFKTIICDNVFKCLYLLIFLDI